MLLIVGTLLITTVTRPHTSLPEGDPCPRA
jgi:hypothetical protein